MEKFVLDNICWQVYWAHDTALSCIHAVFFERHCLALVSKPDSMNAVCPRQPGESTMLNSKNHLTTAWLHHCGGKQRLVMMLDWRYEGGWGRMKIWHVWGLFIYTYISCHGYWTCYRCTWFWTALICPSPMVAHAHFTCMSLHTPNLALKTIWDVPWSDCKSYAVRSHLMRWKCVLFLTLSQIYVNQTTLQTVHQPR